MVIRARASRRTSKPRCASIWHARVQDIGSSFVRLQKRRATGCPRLPTTAVLPAPTLTGRWRWSLSSAPNRRPRPRTGSSRRRAGAERDRAARAAGRRDPREPEQPRKRFDGEARAGLADRAEPGTDRPLLVRPRAAGGYEIVAGERRWRAAREAASATVPAVVREAETATRFCRLIENVAREQLTPVEEARATVLMDEFGLYARRDGGTRGSLEAIRVEPDPHARSA